MKKIFKCIIVVLCLTSFILCLTGCKKEGEENDSELNTQSKPTASTQTTESGGATSSGQTNTTTSSSKPATTVTQTTPDIDLTAMSGTIVYGEVYNMLANPEDYMGKKIKARGNLVSRYYEQTDTRYFWIVIPDAAGCCSQGLEFIWKGDHYYPDDYPSEGTEIEILGRFDSYQEYGKTYYYLLTDKITVI